MSLSAALAANRADNRGPKCFMCTLIETLDVADAAALAEAFADPRFTSAAITRALKSEGHTVSSNTVIRHRKGECRG